MSDITFLVASKLNAFVSHTVAEIGHLQGIPVCASFCLHPFDWSASKVKHNKLYQRQN